LSIPSQHHLPGGPQPREAWGFEVRSCKICHERKGGSPYRFCACQRKEHGLGDWQPHLAANPPKWKKGDWVADTESSAPNFGTVVELFQDHVTGEWLVNIDLWQVNGSNPHRLSPPEGGPTKFEPACNAFRYKKITPPELPFKAASGRLLPLGENFVHLLTFINE